MEPAVELLVEHYGDTRIEKPRRYPKSRSDHVDVGEQ